MKTVMLSKGEVNLRDIKLPDMREARSYAQRTGIFNQQDCWTKLYLKVSDKPEQWFDSCTCEDDAKLVEAVKQMFVEANTVGDAKKQ